MSFIQGYDSYTEVCIWHSNKQGIIAADMVIAEVQKKWVGHVKFMKYLR